MKGLRLDQKSSAMSVISAGHSAESKLIRMVAGLEGKVVMPPTGARLTPAEIGILRAWIDQGANWAGGGGSQHWSFVKPVRPAVPAAPNRAWVRNPIDSFIAAKLDTEKIAPSPEAGKNTLLRRVSLDLTGLPPTPAEVDAFVNDTRPDAYERLVDRLMDSPHYGEKWARPWLDLARYADSDGYEKDLSRPWAWRYRQWVIEALNRNMPFDEFTVEQIAGDLLPNAGAGTAHRHRISPQHADQSRGRHRPRAVPRRAGDRPHQYGGHHVARADRRLRAVPQPQIRSRSPRKSTTSFSRSSTRPKKLNIDAPMPGELGPYLAAKGEYERKRQELLAEYNVPELQAAVGREAA